MSIWPPKREPCSDTLFSLSLGVGVLVIFAMIILDQMGICQIFGFTLKEMCVETFAALCFSKQANPS